MCDPPPETGATCADGTQPCLKGTAICFCSAMKWSCNDLGGGAGGAGSGDELECPATEPADGSDCGDTFGVCPYDQGGCACYDGTWTCQ
jgi:hypothetical protein